MSTTITSMETSSESRRPPASERHPQASTATTPLILAAFAAVYILWGSTYLAIRVGVETVPPLMRSEEHTSELQSPCNLVCRLLLEKKNKIRKEVRRADQTVLTGPGVVPDRLQSQGRLGAGSRSDGLRFVAGTLERRFFSAVGAAPL